MMAPNQGEQTLTQTALDLVERTFLGRDLTAAYVRLGIFVVAFSTYWILVVAFLGFPGEISHLLAQSTPAFLVPFINIAATFFHPQVIMHLLPVIGALFFAFFFAALYLTDLFELESFWTAYHYLIGSIFGLGFPRLRIDQSNINSIDPYSPVKRIGGPGYVRIHLGYAAIFEDTNGISHVYGRSKAAESTGIHAEEDHGRTTGRSTFFVQGFESLKDVVDLRDRIGKVDEIRSITRDGIEVYARDAQMVFRVFGGEQERSLEYPYPYTSESIRQLVYGQAVGERGKKDWAQALSEIVQNEIRSFVARHTLEEFLALQPYRHMDQAEARPDREPSSSRSDRTFQIPRRQLTDHFHTPALKRGLRDKGLELAWVGVGTWELRDPEKTTRGSDISPGDTILTTWRDSQRAHLYRSPGYIERRRDAREKEHIRASFESWIRTWRGTDRPATQRCFDLLTQIHKQLLAMEERLKEEHDLSPHEDLPKVVQHLDQFTRPKTFGKD